MLLVLLSCGVQRRFIGAGCEQGYQQASCHVFRHFYGDISKNRKHLAGFQASTQQRAAKPPAWSLFTIFIAH